MSDREEATARKQKGETDLNIEAWTLLAAFHKSMLGSLQRVSLWSVVTTYHTEPLSLSPWMPSMPALLHVAGPARLISVQVVCEPVVGTGSMAPVSNQVTRAKTRHSLRLGCLNVHGAF